MALIDKLRGPPEVKGHWNAIGGKVEDLESPEQAMQREFAEETGVLLEEWHPYAILKGPGWEVHWFYKSSDRIKDVVSTTDEVVRVVNVDELDLLTVVPNLRWLVPMALSMQRGEKAIGFTVLEHHV